MSNDLIFSGRVQTRRAMEESIKTYLATLDDWERWKDWFESSVGKTVINLLTGIAEILMFKVEVRSRESYLYTAQTKPAAFLLAQMVGYNPNRKKHSTGTVTATIHPYANNDFIIPKNFQIDAAYPLVISDNYQVTAQDREKTGISVKQGEWVDVEYSVSIGNLDGREWEIINIEETDFQIDDFEVYITVNNETVIVRDKIIYDPSELENYLNLTDFSMSFEDKLAELYANTVIARTDYRGGLMVMFGDGIFGKRLTTSSIVNVRYLKTQGLTGIISTNTDLGTHLIGTHSVSFKIDEKVQGGSNEDSVDKVKVVASRFFQTQARAVTKYDYEAVALAYPGVISSKAQRIDDECCTVCISALRADSEQYITIPWSATEIEQFLAYMDSYKMLSTKIDFWEPEAVYLSIVSRVVVKYNTDLSDLDTRIRAAIQNYCFQLGATFRTTRLITQIMALDANILRVYMDDVNGSECYPDINLPCYGFFEQGSISINFQIETGSIVN